MVAENKRKKKREGGNMRVNLTFDFDDLTRQAIAFYLSEDKNIASHRMVKTWINTVVEAEVELMVHDYESTLTPTIADIENDGTPIGSVYYNGGRRPCYSLYQFKKGRKKGQLRVEIKKADGYKKINCTTDEFSFDKLFDKGEEIEGNFVDYGNGGDHEKDQENI
jgi:hypothetical protein